MTDERPLRFFLTEAHPCSYLIDQEASSLFLDPEEPVDTLLYHQLTLIGFRRSGSHFYRPHCSDCNDCVPVRVPASCFRPSKNLRRIWSKNRDLRVAICAPQLTDEFFDLYQRYVDSRHQDGEMYPASLEQFESFLAQPKPYSRFICFYLEDKLIAVAVNDLFGENSSAIYTFFDPDYDARSLGTLAVLWQIKEAQQLGLEHLYLGYWIKDCRKMRYKNRFRPLEGLINEQWQTLAEN